MTEHPYSLGPLLMQCASFIRSGMTMADIGTDHGYLPVWLVRRGICPSAIAADIHAKPLSKAKKTVQTYHAEKWIQLRLSDGLKNIRYGEAKDIVIAGMGGETIAKILLDTEWIQNTDIHLILQPMSRPEKLRRFLYENGFTLRQEEIVRETNRLYTVMLAQYEGNAFSPSPADCYLGALLKSSSLSTPQYLRWQAEILQKQKSGGKDTWEFWDNIILKLKETADQLEKQQPRKREEVPDADCE